MNYELLCKSLLTGLLLETCFFKSLSLNYLFYWFSFYLIWKVLGPFLINLPVLKLDFNILSPPIIPHAINIRNLFKNSNTNGCPIIAYKIIKVIDNLTNNTLINNKIYVHFYHTGVIEVMQTQCFLLWCSFLVGVLDDFLNSGLHYIKVQIWL